MQTHDEIPCFISEDHTALLSVHLILLLEEDDDETSVASDVTDAESEVTFNISSEVHFTNSKMTG